MQQQITRDNHYVPQWYQRSFLPKGQHKLHVLNLNPAARLLQNGQTVAEPDVELLGPKLAFKEFDLYTTRFGQALNDEIETFLFGGIDKRGADAVRAWIAGDTVHIHRRFSDLFEYLDAQKLRTPKGLDWILQHFRGLPQLELMRQMQALQQIHVTMWSECVREIVSAVKSPIKFLVSDHPVTIYHPKLPPGVSECQYPNDPSIDLVGSQTIFPLSANHCLILTNFEYAENPTKAVVLSRRTNARFRGGAMARTDALIRGRELGDAEVHAINWVLKSRAKKFVAASNPEWLYPERYFNFSWPDIATILLPHEDLHRFGGEIYIGHKDGTTSYWDEFGRTSKTPKFLTKPPLSADLAPDTQCGCGSGVAFDECCSGVDPNKRPSWKTKSIRERNLMLIRGITHILRLEEEKTWLDVRRDLSNDQVRQIHELFAALWPKDTNLIELLPRPQNRRSRGLYLGVVDVHKVSTKIKGMLPYIDELLLVHPFINANSVKQEFSPIHAPARFREQTLRCVLSLMLLEPDIRAGRVHLIPDPVDYNIGYREEIISIAEHSEIEIELGPIDKEATQKLAHEEMMRFIKRLPPADIKSYLQNRLPDESLNLSDETLDSVVKTWKRELEKDPLALLDPPPSSKQGSEFKAYKGFFRETGLFVATLTGAFIYTDSDTQWKWLHVSDGVRAYEENPAARGTSQQLEQLFIEIPSVESAQAARHSIAAEENRTILRNAVIGLQLGVTLPVSKASKPLLYGSESTNFRLRASIPSSGFQRTDVSRLVLTFGRMDDVASVPLAIFLEPVTSSEKRDGNSSSQPQ